MGFSFRLSLFDMFSRFVPGLILIFNIILLVFPSTSVKDIYAHIPTQNQLLTLLIVISLSYIVGIALWGIGLPLSHWLLKADIEHAITGYFKTIIGKPKQNGNDKELKSNNITNRSHKEKLLSLLQQRFGGNLRERSYLNLARAELKEKCENTAYEIDRQNATSIMLRSTATAELIVTVSALVIIFRGIFLNKSLNYQFYGIFAICSFLLTWALIKHSVKLQRWWVRQVFDTFYVFHYKEKVSPRLNFFRANVGAVIINGDGLVLALERSDIKHSWQMPQGGIKENEDPLQAVLREINEETALNGIALELISEYPDWLAYEIPESKRQPKHGRGQVQKWFLFRFIGTEAEINLKHAQAQEFCSWKWTKLQQIVSETASFRREIYKKLAEGFAQYLN